MSMPDTAPPLGAGAGGSCAADLSSAAALADAGISAAGEPADGAGLVAFRRELLGCFTRRGDALLGLADAMLCTRGPVLSPAELSLEPEFDRGYGSAYEGLAEGRVEEVAFRRLLAGRIAPARPAEPLMFAADTTALPRPDAAYADERTMVLSRRTGGDVVLPGWNYSILVGVGWGDSSWVDPLDARRLRPGEDHTAVTLGQVRALLADLDVAGRLPAAGPPPLFLFDSGNDASALAYELAGGRAGHQAQVLVRLNPRRVFRGDPDPRPLGRRGRTARHGRRLPLATGKEAERPAPDAELTATSDRHGTVRVRAWHAMHQELGREGRWARWPAGRELPIVRGSVIQVSVERLPGGRKPHQDMWLFHAAPAGAEPDLDLLWKAYLRRFDQEHFHRFVKVYLGLGSAHLASAQASDRWVQLVMAAYAQLRMASALTDDMRRPWQPKLPDGAVPSPYRTRLAFRRLRATIGSPARPAKFSRPGPGRPKGSKNRPKAPCPPYRKTTKPDVSHTE
ncbi:transposase [Frankia sp. CiP3]|uniref:transposase n=1 Tax=Frankia sp. CiP3 TaxID=2880971 RepID=UPI001EF5571D|nr:transposase [Frankia sp. CiP3]